MSIPAIPTHKVCVASLVLAAGLGELRAGDAAPSAAPALFRDFVENGDQWSPEVRFVARRGTLTAALSDDGIELYAEDEPGPYAALHFEGGRPVGPAGEGEASGCFSFYFGRDPARWRSHVPAYRSVLYSGVYPGIDVRVRGDADGLAYDLLLDPGADLGQVVIRCDGASGLEVDADGSLLIYTAAGPLRQTPPRTWEIVRGREIGQSPAPEGWGTRVVECRFRVIDSSRYGFEAPGRDERLGMVIDPGLEWSTYLAGDGTAQVVTVAAAPEGSGDVFAAGTTRSTDFPFADGTVFPPGEKMYVARVHASGTGIVWAAFIGGTNGSVGRQFNWSALAVDDLGGVAIAGDTELLDHPTTAGAFDRDYDGGIDAWVARFDATGGLVFSSFLGGSGFDSAKSVGFDPAGAVIVMGDTSSADFPTTVGAFDRTYNAPTNSPTTGSHGDLFVTRFSPTGTEVTYSTYVGGQGFEILEDGVVDPAGFVTMTGLVGGTSETPYPTTEGAFDRTWNGSIDAFVARLKLDGGGASDLRYSTFLGSASDDRGTGVAFDPNDPERVTVVGFTWSPGFPTTPGVLKPSLGVTALDARRNAYVTQFRFPAAGGGTLLWSTFHGGTWEDAAEDVVISDTGDVIVTGWAWSHDFPTTRGAYDRSYAGHDHFVSRISPDGSQLLYSTYLGGRGFEENLYGPALAYLGSNTVAVGGSTRSYDFPTTPGAMDRVHDNGLNERSTFAPGSDGYVARLHLENDSSGDLSVAAPQLVHPPDGVNYPSGALRVLFDWSDVADASGIEAYEFQASTRSDFATDWITHRLTVADSQVFLPPLGGSEQGFAILTNWFWRVRAYDRAGNIGAWSATSSFMLGVDGAPTALHAVTTSPNTVPQSGSSTGTIWLTGFAPPGGALVSLINDNPDYVSVPASVTVPAGTKNWPFAISINPNNLPVTDGLRTSANLIATYGTSTYGVAGASVPPGSAPIAEFLLYPVEVTGGVPTTGTLVLAHPAPAGGAVISLHCANPAYAQLPPSVTIPAGGTRFDFPITTSPVELPVFAPLSGVRGPFSSREQFLYVNPEPRVSLASMSISPSSVSAGTNPTATVTLSGPAPEEFGGAFLAVRSSHPAVAAVSPFRGVGAGETSTTFGIGTRNVSAPTTVTISAAYDDGEVSASFTVNPVPPVALASIALNSSTVTSGNKTFGFISLSAPAAPGGQVVELSSSLPAVASVPASCTVPGQLSSTSFDITTGPVSAPTSVTITASSGGVTLSTTLTVNPPPALATVAVSPTSVSSGGSATGTVTFSAAAQPGGAMVSLASSNPSAASVPASVYVPVANSTSQFLVTAGSVSSPTNVTITATHGGVSQTATITVGGSTQTTTVTFTGRIDRNTTRTHTVDIQASGTVTATLSWVDNRAPLSLTVRNPAGATVASGSGSNPLTLTFTANLAGVYSFVITNPSTREKTNYTLRVTYPVGSGTADTTPPTVAISSPTAGATVSGTVTISASASDNVGVTRVDFLVDGALLSSDTTSPYSASWDTTTATNGSHALTARAVDAAGNQTTSAAVGVTVDNAPPPADTTPPTVSISSPANGATVGGTISISASASDNVGVTRVDFLVDGALLSSDTTAPYSASWNTTTATNGSHSLSARAFDAAGNEATSAAVSVTVDNGSPVVLDITLSGVPASIARGNFFTATATVTNTGGSTASGLSVVASFSPSDAMKLEDPRSSSQSVPSVAPGSSQSVSWLIRAERAGSATLTMTLRNSSGQTVDSVSQTLTITD